MVATVAGIHLGLDTHANRPAANTVPDGSIYSCSTHGLLYKSNYVGNSWATFANLAGTGLTDPMTTRGDIIVRDSSNVTARLARGSADTVLKSDGTDLAYGKVLPADLDVSADNTTANASSGHHGLLPKLSGSSSDALLGDGSWGSVGGGGGSRPYIDTLTLHATYGDDFTGALDTGKWTRHVVGSGEETANVGGTNGWMAVDFSAGAAVRSYYQTAPGGDFEVVMSFIDYANGSAHMIGPSIIDSSGNGVAAFFYSSSLAFYLGVLSGYAYASFPTTLPIAAAEYSDGVPIWIGLKKVGTTYSARYSFNGYAWTPYTSGSTQTFTVDRIGFGRYLGTPNPNRMSVDRFNVI